MKAVVLSKRGKASVLKVSDVPIPEIKDEEEVLIKVKAAGINFAEILTRRGIYQWSPKTKSFVLGMEGAGIVEAVGSSVKNVKPGDKVVVGCQSGCYAEYVNVSSKNVFPAIESYSFYENAAFPVSFLTSFVGLRELARVREGESLLVHAAAGSLGIATIRLAKALGLKVAGTTSQQKKIDFLQQKTEIDLTINYERESFSTRIMEWTKDAGVDIILESIGGDVFKESIKCLAPLGRIIVVGMSNTKFDKKNPLTWIPAWKSIPRINVLSMLGRSQGVFAYHVGRLLSQRYDRLHELFLELHEIVQEHSIRPTIDSIIPLKDVAKAHQRIEKRHNIGKVVLKIP
ncbi:MAG: quinone oxidoreductase family protein [Candidatus Hodarchaeales archaeon]